MFAIMPTPVFTFDATSSGGLPPPPQPLAPSRHRPSVSSPLSSSPIRASPSPPPLPQHHHQNSSLSSIFSPPPPRQQPHDTQSSPIARPSSPTRKLFRFATRTPRPNPVVQRRPEEARDSRRRLFLKNVRERSDDKAWERRGGDQELLKLEWWRLNHELRQRKDAELAVFGTTDADIEEAVQLQELSRSREIPRPAADGIDDMMVDAIAREEEAEIEALLSSMPTDGDGDRDMDEGRPESVYFSDEDDYDALFMEFAAEQESGRGPADGQDMDMS